MDPCETAERLRQLLELDREPVAITFAIALPVDVPRFRGRVPSGCSFWPAAESATFATIDEDHAECPIGMHTMGFEVAPERQSAAREFFAHLCGLGYVSEEECNSLPSVKRPHRAVVYGPLRNAERPPDAVLLRGRGYQAMLLFEAAKRLGMSLTGSLMGRPTCGAIPVAIDQSEIAISFGCIGARVYVDLQPDEQVFALPGGRLEEIVSALDQVCSVNVELKRYHQDLKRSSDPPVQP